MSARARALAAITLLVLLCSGCGVTIASSASTHSARAKHRSSSKRSNAVTTQTSTDRTTAKDVSAQAGRPATELIIDGYSQGSLSQLVDEQYRQQGGAESVTIEDDAAPTAYNQLCSHNVDIVDSSAPIDKAELQLCHKDGIEPVQIQVASDAVVLATENETDVGADCLTLAQTRAIFRAGSPVTNWEQLGFDDARLAVAGPNPQNAVFSFFGRYLVGQRTPSLEDFRYDYHSEPEQIEVRKFVIGSEHSGELASAALPQETGEITSINALIAGWKDTLRGAEAWLRSSTRAGKLADVAAAEQKRDRALRALSQLRRQLRTASLLVARNRRVLAAARRVLGHLGVFEYGYYALWEQQLRPLEITAKTSPENCVFPSQSTITSGAYPLSRRLLLTFSLQELRSNQGLRDFLLSYLKDGNRLAGRLALVALPANVLNHEETWLEGTTATTTTTTVTPAPTQNGEENSMSGTGTGVQEPGNETSTTAGTGSGGAASGGSGNSDLVPQGVH